MSNTNVNNFYYVADQKKFVASLVIATSEADAVPWLTFNLVTDSTGLNVGDAGYSNTWSYDFNSDITNSQSTSADAYHNLQTSGNPVQVPKTQVIGPSNTVLVFGNMDTGRVYVHPDNNMSDIHTIMDILKTVNSLPLDTSGSYSGYKFGGIDYFQYDKTTQQWDAPLTSVTLSVMAMKVPDVVTVDKKIILNDKINEVTWATTKADNTGLFYYVDKGKKEVPVLDANGDPTTDANGDAVTQVVDVVSGDEVNIKKYTPVDKVIFNRIRLTDSNWQNPETVYAPNISVECAADKWIYIRNRSTGAIHNTYLSAIDNIHLYVSSIYGAASSGEGIGDLGYLELTDKITKRARDFSSNAYVYTVSAEEQSPINDTARMIIIEDEPVVFAESNGISDGTGYRYMNGDGNDLPFNKLESRSVFVDGKTHYYPIIGVRAPAGSTIRILGAPAGNATAERFQWETRASFIDDIISYILAGDNSHPAGFRRLGFASTEGNGQSILLSDHLGNTTNFTVESSNVLEDASLQDTFLNIYDPLFFEPNLYSPNLDTLELPFVPFAANTEALDRAVFLMRDEYLSNDGNLISGNLTKGAFTTLLVKLMARELKGDELIARYTQIFGCKDEQQVQRDNNGNPVLDGNGDPIPLVLNGAPLLVVREKPSNLVIIKEEYRGKTERRMRRITDRNSIITPEPATVADQTNLHLHSILHLIYDYKGTDGTKTERRQFVIEIKEDRDELSYSFDPTSGAIDQTIQMSESATYFNNRDHHIVRLKNMYTETGDSSLMIELNMPTRTKGENEAYPSANVPYIPVVKLDYEFQRDLQLAFYASSDSSVMGQGTTGEFEAFKTYLDKSSIHYLIDRDILMGYDTVENVDLKENENLEFGRNYLVMDMKDSDGTRETEQGNTVNSTWDFYDSDGLYTRGYFKIEFVPFLNEVIACYYQPGQRILKSNISDRVYYRDSIRGYISLINGDQYLNKSMQYFVEKDIKFRVPLIKDKTDENGNPEVDADGNPTGAKIMEDKIENRRYRLYLDFMPAPPEFDYNKDQKIYDNNIFVTNFSLNDLESNKLFLKFSADETKDDMYKIYFSDNTLMKGISADGKITISYQSMINEVMYNLDKYFGKQRDGDPYDSEVYLGSMVMEETLINEDLGADGNYRIKRVSMKPEFAELQKIIISSDGSTKGADAVVINLTIYMNKNEPKPGELLQQTLNNYYSTQGYRIKVLQEERAGLKLYNLNHLDTRTFLSFNSVYTLHLGLNDSKRIVLRERIVNTLLEYMNDPNGTERNEDQTLTLANYDDFLRVPLRRKMDIVKEIGADVLTIDPSHNLTLETFYDVDGNMINNNLLTRTFFLAQLDVTNFEFVYVLNNRKFAMNDEDVEDADDDILVGTGFLKLVFTSIVNKILSVHFDNVDNQLNLTKLSIQRRIYYKDSLLNDYISLINEDFGKFNKELEYFIEATIDNVTYRLQLDFKPMPQVYDITAATQIFNLGYMVNLKTTLAVAYDANVTLLFSADNTNDDMHQVNLSKSLLLNNVDNNGNLLLSYTTIRNVIETEMKGLYGKSWYDREMYLFGVIANGQYVMGDGQNNGIKILISPFEYNINDVVEIDLDLGTITFVDQLPDEKWDYSVKAYGEFIAGYYQPNDFIDPNLDGGKTVIKVFKKAFAQSALLFDQRNPDYNVKEVFLNTEGTEVAVVALGNVDPTSLQNLTNLVFLPNYEGVTVDKTDATDPNYNPNTFTHINPTYLFNPITTKQASTIKHTKLMARGFDLQNKMVKYWAKDNLSEQTDTMKTAYLNPIVHKMLSGSLYTRFNNTVFISYKDSLGLEAPVDPSLAKYDFMNPTDPNNHYLSSGVSYKKRDLIISKIKSELETVTAGNKLFDSRLFKLYNALGKYETDLENRLQLINADVNDVENTTASNKTPYDLDNFTINLLVKLKGVVTGNTGSTAAGNSIDESTDNDPMVNSGASNNPEILNNLVNEFFPESNVYVDDVAENQSTNAYTYAFNARIRYETLIKFQFINKKVTDQNTLITEVDRIGGDN